LNTALPEFQPLIMARAHTFRKGDLKNGRPDSQKWEENNGFH